jgi:tryptophan 2,3-dioxygenase
LSEAELKNLDQFNHYFFQEEADGSALTLKARRAAHFIMLYRGYPLLHLPYELISYLLEIDEQLSIWRYRHMSMVQRMIGSRVGTGGSTGKDYLAGAVQKHSIFGEFSRLTSFLLNRRNIPSLSRDMEKLLGFFS